MRPDVRPEVYLCAIDPRSWAAFIPIYDDGGWRGWREFSTQIEAMEYAARVLAPAVLGVPAKEEQ